MSDFNITVPGGRSAKLLTGGKFCPEDIIVTAGKSEPIAEKDVNFYDYDGTLLHAYTLEEAQALTELPPAPTPAYDFLVFDRWNWTLAQVNALDRKMDIGALYDTTDGAVYCILDIQAGNQLAIPIVFVQSVSNGVTVDWGDGSATERASTSGIVRMTHTYQTYGKYTLKLAVSSGNVVLGGNNYSESFWGANAYTAAKSALKEIYIGRKCERIGHVGLSRFSALEKMCGHYDLNAGESAIVFTGLKFYIDGARTHYGEVTGNSLLSILCPCGSASSIQPMYAANCSLRSAKIGSSATSVGANAYKGNILLQDATIPANVTSIGATAYSGCSSMANVYFKGSTPPALSADAASSVFNGVLADCVYHVPAGSLSTYQNATNYGSIAAKMVEDNHAEN